MHSPGNIYTGSPKHVNLVPYQATNTCGNNGYNLLPPQSTQQFHPLQSQMMYHPLDRGGVVQTNATPFGTPTKKFILAEMPIEYSQLGGSNGLHQQQQQKQLQDAVTNVSPPMFSAHTNLHNNAHGLPDNCVILLNPNNNSNSVVAMHSE